MAAIVKKAKLGMPGIRPRTMIITAATISARGLLNICVNTWLDMASELDTRVTMMAVAVDDLVQRGGVQPVAERRLALVAKRVQRLQRVPARGLHQVGAVLACAQSSAHAQPDEPAQPRQVLREQPLEGGAVTGAGLLDQLSRGVVVGGRLGRRGHRSPC